MSRLMERMKSNGRGGVEAVITRFDAVGHQKLIKIYISF